MGLAATTAAPSARPGRLTPDAATKWFVAKAVHHLGHRAFVELLRHEDANDLARRWWAWTWLNNPITPFFSLDELEDELRKAHAQRMKHATTLAATGFMPATGLAPWTTLHVGSVLCEHMLHRIRTEADDTCAEDIRRLRCDRPMLIELGDAVLRRCAEALGARSARGLLDDVFEEVRARMTGTAVRDHLRFEADLRDILATGSRRMIPCWPTGGLSSLLAMVGHVDCELEDGGIADVREELHEAMDGAIPPLDYFSLLRDRRRATIDRVLDRWPSLVAGARNAWLAFERRVDRAIDRLPMVEAVAVPLVPAEHRLAYHRAILDHADRCVAALTATGALPQPGGPPAVARAAAVKAVAGNWIRVEGDRARVSFRGREAVVRGPMVVRLLAVVLPRPGDALGKLQLSRALAGDAPRSRQTCSELEAAGVTRRRDPRRQDPSVIELAGEVRALAEEIDEAESAGDSSRCSDLRDRREARLRALRVLCSDTGDEKRAADQIRVLVKRAKAALRVGGLPSLAALIEHRRHDVIFNGDDADAFALVS